ncbi:alpha-crystallin A chain [Rhineura floridana]|uniref:alpha-crystallin A chain n=1 Tax=Rhineura floridana TaxID=261503 RepID=UPI002AC845EC|nr:alpha-crystallin A chain [Rhineura floridana]
MVVDSLCLDDPTWTAGGKGVVSVQVLLEDGVWGASLLLRTCRLLATRSGVTLAAPCRMLCSCSKYGHVVLLLPDFELCATTLLYSALITLVLFLHSVAVQPWPLITICCATPSKVRFNKDKFTIFLDVKHFSPEDLSVKVIEDFVEIHGKHSERQDDRGYISREFHHRYRLPSNVDQPVITCSLSADGMLTLSVPKVQSNTDPSHSERPIPVSCEEKPASAPSS